MKPGFAEDRMFGLLWGIFLGLTTLLLAGTVLAPLFACRGMERLAGLLYRFYSLTCHQLANRSWFVCGHKFGVCVRCFSSYLFFVPAGAVLFITSFRSWLSRRSFLRFVLPVFFALISPLTIDGLGQFLGAWESTNLLRLVTGGLAGIGTALVVGYLFTRFVEKLSASLR